MEVSGVVGRILRWGTKKWILENIVMVEFVVSRLPMLCFGEEGLVWTRARLINDLPGTRLTPTLDVERSWICKWETISQLK